MPAPTRTVPETSGATKARLASLLVVIPRPDEVAAYLERHDDLADILSVACASARAEFGDETELSLELYRDPEITDQYLALYVRQPVYDRQVMARLDNVRARYRDLLTDRSGWLHVTTDFRPPGARHGV